MLLLNRYQSFAMRADVAHRHSAILRFSCKVRHLIPQGIRTIPGNNIKRIDTIAFALTHCFAKTIKDFGMNVDLMKGNLACVE